MTRLNVTRTLPLVVIALLAALALSACGTNYVHIPTSDPTYNQDYQAALIFHQRCGGCHSLTYAGTYGSGQNPRTYQNINGPNFNARCERPAIRVLYAIENGGMSGAYMPQNIVVGKQAREVALFVSKFAGRAAPKQPGVPVCQTQTVGSLPAFGAATASGTGTSGSGAMSGATGSSGSGGNGGTKGSGNSGAGSAGASGSTGSGANTPGGSSGSSGSGSSGTSGSGSKSSKHSS